MIDQIYDHKSFYESGTKEKYHVSVNLFKEGE